MNKRTNNQSNNLKINDMSSNVVEANNEAINSLVNKI